MMTSLWNLPFLKQSKKILINTEFLPIRSISKDLKMRLCFHLKIRELVETNLKINIHQLQELISKILKERALNVTEGALVGKNLQLQHKEHIDQVLKI